MHTNVAASGTSRDVVSKNTGGVLIVEDEEFVREAAAEFLESQGYEVFKAANFAEALIVFRENSARISLLLTDVIIPGQNGCELGKVLRQLSQHLQILYISGYSQKTIAQKVMLDSHSHFMAKPFSSEKLLAAVREAFTTIELH